MADALTKTEGQHGQVPLQAWSDQRPVVAYLLTLGIVTAVYLLRAWLAPTLGNEALYLFLVPPGSPGHDPGCARRCS